MPAFFPNRTHRRTNLLNSSMNYYNAFPAAAAYAYGKYRRRGGRKRSGRALGPATGNRYRNTISRQVGHGSTMNRRDNSKPSMSKAKLEKLLVKAPPLLRRDINQSGSGIPQYNYCKQVFASVDALGDGSTVPIAATNFNLNSIFEPRVGDSTHQPQGRDIMAGIYNDYFVVGCKWTIRIFNRANGTTTRGWVHVDTDATSDITSYEEALERPDVLVWTVGSNNAAAPNSSRHATVSGYTRMVDHLIGSGGDFEEQFNAGVGADPATTVKLHLQAEDQDGTAIASSGLSVETQLTYYVCYRSVVAATSS